MSEINFFNIDCMEFMKGKSDNYYDLAIVDPPYGIKVNMNSGKRKGKRSLYANKKWDLEPPKKEYFLHLIRMCKNQIIWGFNNYNHVSNVFGSGRIFWDKVNGENNDFSDGELAYQSFDKRVIKYKHQWSGALRESEKGVKRIHSTQKPIALYKWLLKNYAKEGDKIFDSHGGSMSIALACHDMGFDLDICEIDKDYFKAGKNRYENHIKQVQLFKPEQNHGTQMKIE